MITDWNCYLIRSIPNDKFLYIGKTNNIKNDTIKIFVNIINKKK